MAVRTVAAGFFALLLATGSAGAQSLMLAPGSLMLDERQRAGTVIIGSSGGGFASFEVSDVFFIQDANGRLHATDPVEADNSAAAFLRVGPRRFATEPGRGQQLRIAARPPLDLDPGEYRVHLSVTHIGGTGMRPDETVRATTAEGVSVVIPIRVARAVRVLYRHQVRPEGGRLEAVQRRAESPQLDFDVVRLGETSLIAQTQIIARDGGGAELARWDGPGISIYPENDRRRFSAAIPTDEMPADARRLCVRMNVTDPAASETAPVETCEG